MAEHGCPRDFQVTTVNQSGVLQSEKCDCCGYRITYGPAPTPSADTGAARAAYTRRPTVNA
ncbi:hypothetical protein [Streptomyces caatingaensis]|nr:hypothetical protein [Streptomyces caatingaensis]